MQQFIMTKKIPTSGTRIRGERFIELKLKHFRNGAGGEHGFKNCRINFRPRFRRQARQITPVPFGYHGRPANFSRVTAQRQRVAARGGDGIQRIHVQMQAHPIKRHPQRDESVEDAGVVVAGQMHAHLRRDALDRRVRLPPTRRPVRGNPPDQNFVLQFHGFHHIAVSVQQLRDGGVGGKHIQHRFQLQMAQFTEEEIQVGLARFRRNGREQFEMMQANHVKPHCLGQP